MNLLEQVENARINGGTITYHFENGSKQVSGINKELFVNEKGRQRSAENVLEVIDSIAWDLKAESFEL